MHPVTRVITPCTWPLGVGKPCLGLPAVYDVAGGRFLCAAHGKQLDEEAQRKAAVPQTEEEAAIESALAWLKKMWRPPNEPRS